MKAKNQIKRLKTFIKGNHWKIATDVYIESEYWFVRPFYCKGCKKNIYRSYEFDLPF